MKLASALDGVLLVDKAAGMTSHDVVALVRRRLGIQKVGHCGTLDPFATGLLLVVIGRGTKIQDLLMSEDKEYVGTMRLGVSTSSQDRDGVVTETRDFAGVDVSQIEAAFAKYHGDFYQTPPMVSAIKKEGVPLYKLAREGKVVAREPRFVHVYAHEIIGVRLPDVDFRVICSKGFYVRTYAHDIGEELGCGAHLHALRRTKSGRFSVASAITVDELRGAGADYLAGKRARFAVRLTHAGRLTDVHWPVRRMELLRQIEELGGVPGPVFLAIGVFDGLHLGHQAVIAQAATGARLAGGSAVVLTFHPHPVRVLRPEAAPRLLTSTPHKARLVGSLGVHAMLVQEFTLPFARTTAEAFLRPVLAAAQPRGGRSGGGRLDVWCRSRRHGVNVARAC